ncbi:MAG: [LysW]-lysine hydrolase [Chloroflexota bacterium]|nr:[LysW]-lysine hydrolase [Chloroflexota bacterium]
MALSSPLEQAVATGNQPAPAAEDVELLRRLVAIPSLSDHEGEAVSELVTHMARRGFRTEIDRAGNAIGTIGHGPKRIVLLGHIDTVPGWIPVRIEDGTLHGRGAVDAKGPLCTFVAAATRAAATGNATITVVGAAGEERMGSPGATEVAAWLAPDFCVIGEPSGWDAVCLGYRGTLSFQYRLRHGGRHSAGPGEAVAEQAIAFWNALTAETEAFNATASTGGNFNTLTPTLRSISTTSDGLADEVVLSIGIRLPAGFDAGAVLTRLRDLAGDAELTVDGIQEAYRSDKRTPLVPPFLRAIRAEGGTPRFTLKLGTSDMTVVGPAWDCPIVAYGPGDAALDHTPEERLELADYGRAITVLTRVLESL